MPRGKKNRNRMNRDSFLIGRKLGKSEEFDTPEGKMILNPVKGFARGKVFRKQMHQQLCDKSVKDYLDGIKNIKQGHGNGNGNGNGQGRRRNTTEV